MPHTYRNLKLVAKLYKEFLQITSNEKKLNKAGKRSALIKDNAQITNKIWENTQHMSSGD